MDSSIHLHLIAAKLQSDVDAATRIRSAREAKREARRPAPRRRRFVRRAPTVTVSAR